MRDINFGIKWYGGIDDSLFLDLSELENSVFAYNRIGQC